MHSHARWYIGAGLMLLSLGGYGSEPAAAAKAGDMDGLIRLIQGGADANRPAPDGTTALAYAAYRDDLAMVEYLLLRAEAEVNTANDYGATALYLAAGGAEPALVERLLKAGADPDIALLSGETPLMAAANRGRREVVEVLLDHGADPDARETRGGQTALMWAIAEAHPGTAELLISRGADVNVPSNSGFTPLMFAARQGDERTAARLIEAGAQVNAGMFRSGLTPLMIASIGGYTGVAGLLLDHGAMADAMDKNGKSVLHHAVTCVQHAGIVSLLLSRGADPDVRLDNPKKYGGNGVDPQGATPLVLAAGENNLDAVIALLNAGADPHLPTLTGTSALMMAAGAGASPSQSFLDMEIDKATATARLLIEHGADVSAAGQFGWTAMHAAAYHGRNAIIALLIEHGANPDTRDGFGQTPLSIAHAVVTEEIGDAYFQIPRTFRRDTADLLLSLGATPLAESGVRIAAVRASEE